MTDTQNNMTIVSPLLSTLLATAMKVPLHRPYAKGGNVFLYSKTSNAGCRPAVEEAKKQRQKTAV